MDPTTLVIAAYGYARERGASRTDAFRKAVRAFCTQHPGFPVHTAGAEVARLLLAAAKAQDARGTETLPAAGEMEYVEPA